MKSLNPTRKPTSIRSLASSLVLLLVASSAWACKCSFPTVEDDFQNSDVVFSGKALRIDSVEDERRIERPKGRFLPTVEVELELDEVWKGKEETRVTVLTAMHEPTCGFDFSIGKRYVVFAKARKLESDEDTNDAEALYTGLCSANHELDYDRASEALIEQLDELKSETQQESEVEPQANAGEHEE